MLRHRPLVACALALTLFPSVLPAQDARLVRKVEAVLAGHSHAAVVKELRELGPSVIPALIEVMRSAERDGDGEGIFGFGGGRGGRFGRSLYPSFRPDFLQAGVRVSRPKRTWGDLDNISGDDYDQVIEKPLAWGETTELAQRAAHMIGELPRLSAQHVSELSKVYDDVLRRLRPELCIALGKIGRPAVPLLIAKAESDGRWPLRALYRVGPAASRDLLMRIRELDPKVSSWVTLRFWALLDRAEDPMLRRRMLRELPRWINAGGESTRMFIAARLAEAWREQPDRFVQAMGEADRSGRYTLVEAMAQIDEGLSANVACVLLGMMRDADRRYAPGMLCWVSLNSGSAESLSALGEELARLIPGQGFERTMVLLELAAKLGPHAAPLKPWLLAYRENASPRLAEKCDAVLAGIAGEAPELAAEKRPGLLEAWRAGEARIAASQREREYRQWRERLGDEVARKAALMELRPKDAEWSWFLERELEELYVPPKSPGLRLAPPEVPEKLDHDGARRWLEESRVLPEKPFDIHRGFLARPAAQLPKETTRLWLTQGLARFVAEAPWDGDWDAHKLVALMDADDPALRELARETMGRFVGDDADDQRAAFLAFPIRDPDLMQVIARDLEGHRWPLRRALELGDEQQRLAAYLIMAAALRADPKQKFEAFSIRFALDDWHEGIALVAAELLLALPKEHPLLEEFGWNDWLGFAAVADRKVPALAARKLQAVTSGAVPDWVRVRVKDWLLEHPLTRYALLQYLKKLGEHAKFIEPKLVALREQEAAKAKPDAALLADIDAVLQQLK